MQFEFDPSRRQDTLDQRGLDTANAAEMFEGYHLTLEDDRFDYGETRYITIGFMAGRMVVHVWTRRAIHVASSA